MYHYFKQTDKMFYENVYENVLWKCKINQNLFRLLNQVLKLRPEGTSVKTKDEHEICSYMPRCEMLWEEFTNLEVWKIRQLNTNIPDLTL